jgi:hypothetical protein
LTSSNSWQKRPNTATLRDEALPNVMRKAIAHGSVNRGVNPTTSFRTIPWVIGSSRRV